MPQMAPINWLSLFLLFFLIFILFNMVNYYIYMPSMNKTKMSKKINMTPMNWKW
uniref:ATP synthase complex subunit 8 n=1 Tax=Volucella nigricans TaxID=2684213 RepID=A0A6B9D4R4_9MUSC|nr:ATP synthase F0 subunit 8 [Volucella nigricans]QGW56737.1 ATP synthase F0 subunit 8 [Volucella nigricans]UXF58219.1 ATP synthase F0 subunit 8 [Volucella nigricans]